MTLCKTQKNTKREDSQIFGNIQNFTQITIYAKIEHNQFEQLPNKKLTHNKKLYESKIQTPKEPNLAHLNPVPTEKLRIYRQKI